MNQPVALNMEVPPNYLTLLQVARAILKKPALMSIAGGALRALYMRQKKNLSEAVINDIDIFVAISCEEFLQGKERFVENFGSVIRQQVGTFDQSETKFGLMEFMIPPFCQGLYGNARSVQFNFSQKHPWADAPYYVKTANLGINQIALKPDGTVLSSDLFLRDMGRRTISMNPQRPWTYSDHAKTKDKAEDMIRRRPEFAGWEFIPVQGPNIASAGYFWEQCR